MVDLSIKILIDCWFESGQRGAEVKIGERGLLLLELTQAETTFLPLHPTLLLASAETGAKVEILARRALHD